jgi:hypothetical protein
MRLLGKPFTKAGVAAETRHAEKPRPSGKYDANVSKGVGESIISHTAGSRKAKLRPRLIAVFRKRPIKLESPLATGNLSS